MTVTVKSKDLLVVPPSVQRRARLKAGDRLEFKVSGGVITIVPKLPSSEDEYTPEQRRAVDARLARARKGPYYGPFNTPDEAVKFLRKEMRSRKTGKHPLASIAITASTSPFREEGREGR
jgi:bifunctional DNA-binding transcriptional regulator/antitoxin component of YhaV-PrlF toxin-antitoxin module